MGKKISSPTCKTGVKLMYEISILHDHVTAFLHGQGKHFFSENGYLINSKAPMTSLNVHIVMVMAMWR